MLNIHVWVSVLGSRRGKERNEVLNSQNPLACTLFLASTLSILEKAHDISIGRTSVSLTERSRLFLF